MTVVENTMYYPGWEVSLDGKSVPINYLNKIYPGRIVYEASAGKHLVITTLRETPLRSSMDLISGLGLTAAGAMILWTLVKFWDCDR
jgi:hypothetical protein